MPENKELTKFCDSILKLNPNIFFVVVTNPDGKIIVKLGKEDHNMDLGNQSTDFFSKISMVSWVRKQVPKTFGKFTSALISYENITIFDARIETEMLLSVYMDPYIEQKTISTIERLVKLYAE